MFYGEVRRHAKVRYGGNGKKLFEVDEDVFNKLVRAAAQTIKFDEEFYLKTYPDVAKSVAEGNISSAYEHFLKYGYLEDRLPFDVRVDEGFYCSTYTDVLTALKRGDVYSARAHFKHVGLKEGRLPSEGFRYFGSRFEAAQPSTFSEANSQPSPASPDFVLDSADLYGVDE